MKNTKTDLEVCRQRNIKYCLQLLKLFVKLFIFFTFLLFLIDNIVFQIYTCTCLTGFAALLCVCIYFPDNDIVLVETCRKDINGKLLYIIDCAICWLR